MKANVRFEINVERFRIKRQFSLLARGYDASSLISSIAMHNLSLYRSVVQPEIEAIKKRKNLTDGAAQKDGEILALLRRRDMELRRLNVMMLDVFLKRKKQPSDCEFLRERIYDALQEIKKLNYATLAMKLGKHSADALRMEMARCGLSIKELKKEKANKS
jgi:hypothetical protein